MEIARRIGALFLIVVFLISFSSCRSDKEYNWADVEKDVERLEKIGFTAFHDNNPDTVQMANDVLRSELEYEGVDLTLNVISVLSLSKGNDRIAAFYEFENASQAEEYANFKIASLSEDRAAKFALMGSVVITVNNDEAIELLEYDFK